MTADPTGSSERSHVRRQWTDPQVEILDASASAFMAGGYEATTLNDIADVLGATKGRIYHYYRSKAALFLDVMSRATSMLYEEIEPIARRSASPVVRLEEMAASHCRTTIARYPYYRVTAAGVLDMHIAGAELRSSPRLQEYLELRDAYEDLFSDVIRDGIEEGSFRPIAPRIGSKEVLGVLNWMTIWYQPSAGRELDPSLVEELATFTVNGLLLRTSPAFS